MRKLIKKVIIKIGDNYIIETTHKDKKENIRIKSKINKINDDKYEIITYDDKSNNSIKSKIICDKLEVKILINSYIFL